MNKGELIDALASLSGLTKTDVHKVLDALFNNTVPEVLSQGGQITIPGFGTFSRFERKAREGRNPRTGEKLKIKASHSVKFKTGNVLKRAVQKA